MPWIPNEAREKVDGLNVSSYAGQWTLSEKLNMDLMSMKIFLKLLSD